MIRSKSPQQEVIIDLTGPDGNSFALLAYAKRVANQLDLDFNQIKNEMKSSDYETLINSIKSIIVFQLFDRKTQIEINNKNDPYIFEAIKILK